MKKFQRIIATSHIDMHNEMISKKALEEMADRMNERYTPISIEHDPRIPPVGRIASARIVELEDGEYGVEGVGEIFEAGDTYVLNDDSKEIPIHDDERSDKIRIIFDRNYENETDQEIINELGNLLGSNPEEEIKKALEPLDILTIAGIFVLGEIASGFFKKMGSDAFDALKKGISKLFRRRELEQGGEHLLVFRSLIAVNETYIEVETILTNPSEEDIDEFFATGLQQVDSIVSQSYDPRVGLRKITLEYSNKVVKLAFGIRKDAVPLFFRSDPKAENKLSYQQKSAKDVADLDCSIQSRRFHRSSSDA